MSVDLPSEEDHDEFMDDVDQEGANADVNEGEAKTPKLPEMTRSDKTLKEILDMMTDEDYTPIIPDAVTDYYLNKNGFETSDIRIKRILALATQKFINDIATDAYEYSRIRSASSVYNSSNPQARARQLVAGQQNQGQMANEEEKATSSGGGGSSSGQQGRISLTMEDLSSALSDYGLNVNKPGFYR